MIFATSFHEISSRARIKLAYVIVECMSIGNHATFVGCYLINAIPAANTYLTIMYSFYLKT
jgi:hypothetical protein